MFFLSELHYDNITYLLEVLLEKAVLLLCTSWVIKYTKTDLKIFIFSLFIINKSFNNDSLETVTTLSCFCKKAVVSIYIFSSTNIFFDSVIMFYNSLSIFQVQN